MQQLGAGRRRWTLLLLFLAGTLSLFDRQIVNVLGQQIKMDLGISDGKLGLLTGTAFGLFYATFGIPFARLADRRNRVFIIAASLMTWSLFTGACGAAANFIQLFLARMGVGIGEAGCQPSSVSLVSDIFPPERRTSATAILLVGAPAGACLGLLLGGYMGTTWGWRTALLVAAVPGVLLSIVVLLTMKDPRRRRSDAHEGDTFSAAVRILAGRRALRWLTVSLACQTFFIYASGAWLPVFFIRAHGLSALQVGAALGVAVGMGGALGATGLGYLCDLMRDRGKAIDWPLTQTIMLLNFPLVLLTVSVPDTNLAFGAMFVLNMVVYGYVGPIPVLIQQQATAETKGLAIGGTIAVSNIISLGVGVPAVGLLSDVLQPALGVSAVGYALAIAVGGAALLGFVALLLAQRHAAKEVEV